MTSGSSITGLAWGVQMRGEEYLTKKKQYSLVYNRGSFKACRLLSIKMMPNGLGFSRYGFIVSRRIGKAVVRNGLKRRLREILRQTPLKPGWDIVFFTRPVAAAASFGELRESILGLLSGAQLLLENYEKACPETN
jgi:ribonuclease P protein component